jgi:hypothetical protein
MFSIFPIHRPRLGISLRAQALELVEVRRRWSRVPTVMRLACRSLPAGLLAPSAAAPNMADPAAVAKELDALLHGIHDRAVAVDLPMACGTPALCHFETFPNVHAEQEALLRWRLRQEEHLTAPDLVLRWHTFPAAEPLSTGVSVLVVAIRKSILDQYHQVCEAANLIPVSMGFSTFSLLNIAHLAFPTAGEVYLAHRTAEALIVLAFRHGRPVGLRVKPARRINVELKAELCQTLQYFTQDDLHRDRGTPRTTPLYLVEEGVSAASQDQSEVWTMSEQPLWAVPVLRANWATAPIESTVAAPDHFPFGALACVLAA